MTPKATSVMWIGLVLIIINAWAGGQFAQFWAAMSQSGSPTSGPGGSKKIPGSAAVKPKVPGQCPQGYLWDPGSKTCLKELG